MHPAEHNLLANLSFNHAQLQDLVTICDAATEHFSQFGQIDWARRIQDYRVIFELRSAELETLLKEP